MGVKIISSKLRTRPTELTGFEFNLTDRLAIVEPSLRTFDTYVDLHTNRHKTIPITQAIEKHRWRAEARMDLQSRDSQRRKEVG